jgi:hypothetical protein
MVVTDGAGRPVSGLTRQDFAVTDNKQPQPILTFKAVAGAPRADAPQQAIFVIDEVNAAFLDVSRARDELSGFLRRNGGSLPMSATILLRTDTGVTMSGSPRAMERPLLMISMGQLRDSIGTASGLRTIRRSQGVLRRCRPPQPVHTGHYVTHQVRGEATGKKLVIWIGPGVQIDKPGLAARTRAGYYAQPIASQSRPCETIPISGHQGIYGYSSPLESQTCRSASTALQHPSQTP